MKKQYEIISMKDHYRIRLGIFEPGGETFDFVHPFNDSLDFTRVLSEVVDQNRL